MARRIAAAILRWTHEGELPLVVDATSCSHALLSEVGAQLEDDTRERFEQVRVIDSIAWVHDSLLPALHVARKADSVAVHPPCAAIHLGLEAKLQSIAETLADEVILPAGTTCCGTAGDRGLLHPELPASALRGAAEELDGRALSACLCSNRTCEIGLQQVTGRNWSSFILPLERLAESRVLAHAD